MCIFIESLFRLNLFSCVKDTRPHWLSIQFWHSRHHRKRFFRWAGAKDAHSTDRLVNRLPLISLLATVKRNIGHPIAYAMHLSLFPLPTTSSICPGNMLVVRRYFWRMTSAEPSDSCFCSLKFSWKWRNDSVSILEATLITVRSSFFCPMFHPCLKSSTCNLTNYLFHFSYWGNNSTLFKLICPVKFRSQKCRILVPLLFMSLFIM